VPYLVEPMRALDNRKFSPPSRSSARVSRQKRRSPKTGCCNVCADPANMLWYMQTDDGRAAYVKNRINPMINAHAEMRARQGLRASMTACTSSASAA
jgi:hypothetical protein